MLKGAPLEEPEPSSPGQNQSRVSRRAIDFVFAMEPVWVLVALSVIILSVVIGSWGPWVWAALAIVLAPFPLRLWWHRRLSMRTPFDIPIAILILGLFIGLWISGDLSISTGAFVTFIACVSFYYTLVNYPEPGCLLRWALPVYAVLVVVATVFALGQGPSLGSGVSMLNSWAFSITGSIPDLPQLPGLAEPIALGVSGLALNLVILGAISIGVAVFTKRGLLRAATIPAVVFFWGAALLGNQASLLRFFTGESILSRIPLWTETFEMMNGYHIFTGIGPGYWAMAYNPDMSPIYLSHPHNAYIQLYADAGILGLIALILVVVITARLSWGVLRSARGSPWYGFGVGVVVAVVVTAVAGVVINASFGIVVAGEESYRYLASLIPWVLGALLVISNRSLGGAGLAPELEG